MPDRRHLFRRHLPPGVVCRLTGPALPPGGVMGLLLDATAEGVGVYLARGVPPGVVAAVEPMSGPTQQRRPLRARVANVRPQTDGGFVVGARLDAPLADDDLRAWLGP